MEITDVLDPLEKRRIEAWAAYEAVIERRDQSLRVLRSTVKSAWDFIEQSPRLHRHFEPFIHKAEYDVCQSESAVLDADGELLMFPIQTEEHWRALMEAARWRHGAVS